MFRFHKAIIIIFVLFVSMPALAARLQPVDNRDNVAITTGSGKVLTVEQVKQGLKMAGSQRGWMFADDGPGKMTGTNNVRGKHLVKITIAYTKDSYSLKFLSAENMKMKVIDGVVYIHSNYNNWIQFLVSDIYNEFVRM